MWACHEDPGALCRASCRYLFPEAHPHFLPTFSCLSPSSCFTSGCSYYGLGVEPWGLIPARLPFQTYCAVELDCLSLFTDAPSSSKQFSSFCCPLGVLPGKPAACLSSLEFQDAREILTHLHMRDTSPEGSGSPRASLALGPWEFNYKHPLS